MQPQALPYVGPAALRNRAFLLELRAKRILARKMSLTHLGHVCSIAIKLSEGGGGG